MILFLTKFFIRRIKDEVQVMFVYIGLKFMESVVLVLCCIIVCYNVKIDKYSYIQKHIKLLIHTRVKIGFPLSST